MMKALLLLTYHACLRAGEVVKSHTAKHVITIDHVAVQWIRGTLHLTLILRTYKHSNGPSTLIIPPNNIQTYCPVNAVFHYLLKRSTICGPLFINQDNSILKRNELADLVKQLSQLLGLQSKFYNTLYESDAVDAQQI